MQRARARRPTYRSALARCLRGRCVCQSSHELLCRLSRRIGQGPEGQVLDFLVQHCGGQQNRLDLIQIKTRTKRARNVGALNWVSSFSPGNRRRGFFLYLRVLDKMRNVGNPTGSAR
jgi:hypothetical protein